MAGHGFVIFGWSWIEASVLGSQVFEQASMESCEVGKQVKVTFHKGLSTDRQIDNQTCRAAQGLVEDAAIIF